MTLAKFVSAFIILSLMAWSFHKTRSPREVDFEVHAKLQTVLQELIEKRVQESQPYLIQIKFHRLWTQELPPSKDGLQKRVAAIVDFEMITEQGEERVVSQQSFEVTMARNFVSDGEQVWSIDKVEPKTQFVRFSEGELVTLKTPPSNSNAETEAAE